jgi:hypothetical protein
MPSKHLNQNSKTTSGASHRTRNVKPTKYALGITVSFCCLATLFGDHYLDELEWH